MNRRICGPGHIDTGLQGAIQGLPDADSLPLKALLEKQEENETPGTAPLRISVLPYPTDEPGTFGFGFGELLPGNYRMTMFIDNDLDNSPTPCSSRGGGADRGVVTVDNIVVLDLQKGVIETPFVFSDIDCPAELTGLSGEIRLGPTIDPTVNSTYDSEANLEENFGYNWSEAMEEAPLLL